MPNNWNSMLYTNLSVGWIRHTTCFVYLKLCFTVVRIAPFDSLWTCVDVGFPIRSAHNSEILVLTVFKNIVNRYLIIVCMMPYILGWPKTLFSQWCLKVKVVLLFLSFLIGVLLLSIAAVIIQISKCPLFYSQSNANLTLVKHICGGERERKKREQEKNHI